MSQSGGGPKASNVIGFLLIAMVIGFVIANAAGKKDACEAEGKTAQLGWCNDKQQGDRP